MLIEFKCPFCGNAEYKEITKFNGIYGRGGGSSRTGQYECCGCSVVFTDPNKFTRKLELESK